MYDGRTVSYRRTLANRNVFTLKQGSGTIKAGFAGQDHPKCFFPSLCVFMVRAIPTHAIPVCLPREYSRF